MKRLYVNVLKTNFVLEHSLLHSLDMAYKFAIQCMLTDIQFPYSCLEAQQIK